MKRSIKLLWIGFLIFIITFNLLIFLIDRGVLGYMPDMNELENPKSSLASEIYAGDGSLIGKLYIENREPCTYPEISPNVINALIATEDERFHDHSGIDAEAMGRAISGVLTFQHKGGGSTITQQLAKNLLDQGSKNKFNRFLEKLKEQIISVKLEKNLTKEEIITLYLNTVPFGHNAFGIKSAAKTYYNKLPKDLNVEEAAMLVGMLKGSSLYNPLRNTNNRALNRRNTVIDQMIKNNYLTTEKGEQYKAMPLVTDYHPIEDTHHEGVAPYFRQVVESDVKEWCKKNGHNIYKDGLKIYTTIDPKMQEYGELAVRKHIAGKMRSGNNYLWRKHQPTLIRTIRNSDRWRNLKEEDMSDASIMANFNTRTKMKVFTWRNANLEKDTSITPIDSIKYMKAFLQAGFIAMDPASGEVKAWVGGIHHKYFQYDHCNINTKRQVGSTIKPLLYCLAVDNGFSPCMIISCASVFFPHHGWFNPGGASRGAMPMRAALAHSINNATAQILKLVGIENFMNFCKKVGITSKLNPTPAICLGAYETSMIEMLRTYTMFPNYGINTEPIYITRIEDRNGNLLQTFVPQRAEIINEITAYKMIKMMQGSVNFGTAKTLKPRFGLRGELCGKTGTTNDEADAWYIGYSPQLLAASWVGCEDRFLGVGGGDGAHAAMPIWGYFFKYIQADKNLGYANKDKFEKPTSMEGMDECDTDDQTSIMRSQSIRNVSRGIKEPEVDDEHGENSVNNINENGTDQNDY